MHIRNAGNWSESLLKSMYYVTLQHGGAFPHEIERLWCTVAANKRNVIPILEFLISRGLQEMNFQARLSTGSLPCRDLVVKCRTSSGNSLVISALHSSLAGSEPAMIEAYTLYAFLDRTWSHC